MGSRGRWAADPDHRRRARRPRARLSFRLQHQLGAGDCRHHNRNRPRAVDGAGHRAVQPRDRGTGRAERDVPGVPDAEHGDSLAHRGRGFHRGGWGFGLGARGSDRLGPAESVPRHVGTGQRVRRSHVRDHARQTVRPLFRPVQRDRVSVARKRSAAHAHQPGRGRRHGRAASAHTDRPAAPGHGREPARRLLFCRSDGPHGAHRARH